MRAAVIGLEAEGRYESSFADGTKCPILEAGTRQSSRQDSNPGGGVPTYISVRGYADEQGIILRISTLGECIFFCKDRLHDMVYICHF